MSFGLTGRAIMQARKILQHAAKTLAYCVFCLVVLMAALELFYRFQVVDTYAPELRRNNRAEDLAPGQPGAGPTILVLGDSFSVTLANYPSLMRKACGDCRIINSAIGGAGIIQANLVAEHRFRQFSPQIMIYQAYVGNELFDVRYPSAWGRVSLVRNLYWTVAQHLRSIGFLNYRAGHLFSPAEDRSQATDGPGSPAGALTSNPAEFSTQRYYWRTQIHFRAEPTHLQDAVLLHDSRREDFNAFLDELRRLLEHCQAPDCRAYVLVIPHSAQVWPRYLEHMRQLGAQIDNPEALQAETYPFINELRRFLEEDGQGIVDVIDPLPALREHEARGEAMYYANDAHLNPAGQAVVAKLVLEKLGLVK